MSKISKAEKRRYEQLAMKWASEQIKGGLEAKSLKEKLIQMEHDLGMTAEEILRSDPED